MRQLDLSGGKRCIARGNDVSRDNGGAFKQKYPDFHIRIRQEDQPKYLAVVKWLVRIGKLPRDQPSDLFHLMLGIMHQAMLEDQEREGLVEALQEYEAAKARLAVVMEKHGTPIEPPSAPSPSVAADPPKEAH